MAKQFLTPIDLQKNELQNPRLQNLGTDPGAPVEGQIYLNSGDHHARIHNGTTFKTVPYASSDIPAEETVGASGSAGSSADAARSDHVHPMPGLATGVAAGFLSAADKTKLDAATHLATVSTLVLRDGSGRFKAADPSASDDVATRGYVDTMVQGLDTKGSCRAATTGNIALSGTQTIDGVVLSVNDRVLVKDQTLSAQNGLYVVAAGAWSRTTDADGWNELVSAYVWVEEGTTQADTGWVCTVDAGGTLGTTSITWSQFTGAATITAGNGLSKTGNTLDVNVDNSTLEINADTLRVKNLGLTDAHIAAANKDGLAGTACLRTLGGGAQQAAAGNHTHSGVYQPLDATLSALAAYNTNGLLVQTAADTFTGRTLTGPAAGITVSNGNGVAGNPTLALAHDLAALEGLGGTGLAVRSADNTWVQRSIAQGDGITVTNGDGVAGNPTIGVSYGGNGAATTVSRSDHTHSTYMRRVATDLGDGIAVAFAITHNLGTRDVLVSVHRTTTPWDEVVCDIEMTDINTVTLRFAVAPTANQFRAVVVG